MGVVVYWNAAARDLYGWTPEEAIGRNIADLTVPEVGQDIAADIMAALRDGIPWSGGFPVRRKDGTRFPALVTDAGVYRDGVLVGIIGVSTNLGTALRPLLERSTDAALVLRSDGVVIYASLAVRQLFGWSEENITGTPITALLHPDDRPALGRFLQRILAAPGAHPPVELRVRRGQDWGVGGGRADQPAGRPDRAGGGVQPAAQPAAHRPGGGRDPRRAAGDGATDQVDHRTGQGVPRRPGRDHPGGRVRATAQIRPEPSGGDAGRVPPRRRRGPAATGAVKAVWAGVWCQAGSSRSNRIRWVSTSRETASIDQPVVWRRPAAAGSASMTLAPVCTAIIPVA